MSVQLESVGFKSGSVGIPYSETIIASLFAFLDILIIMGTGLVIYLWYSGWDESTYANYLLASGFLAIAIIGGLHSTGLYGPGALSGVSQQTKKVLSVCVVAYLGFLGVLFGLKISATFSRVWFCLWFAAGTSLLCVSRVCMRSLLNKWGQLGRLTRNIVIVGTGDQALRLCEHIAQKREPWNRVVGVLDDRADEDRVSPPTPRFPVSGSVDRLLGFARDHRVDDIIVSMPLSTNERLFSLVRKLRELPVNIHFTCDLEGFKCGPARFSHIDGVPLIGVAQKPLSGWNLIAKEIEDKVVAGITILVLLPVFVLIALAIKLDSTGPVLFRQRRHGFNNEVFAVFKFRTMDHNWSEQTVPQARRNDPRVTRVGRLLRRTSLDELPQLFNVLEGSMSLVGPRPHALPHNNEYAKSIPGFFSRHRIKPGMTGWAQVNGLRGETDCPEKMSKRVEYDLYYIENWSLLFDLQILIKTLFVGFVHKNAY
ncbi:MAG: undecaprenyl-phosphate glucose phosphotransferase [Nitrososphaera sp.]|nr:undecaprenyl-phosphate glucose phosphotransferase [Nitrososphaera sp.]